MAPLLGQVVELHHLGAPVRFARAEADRPENAGDIRRVVLRQPRLRQHVPVDQPLERVHADDVGLGLFEAAEEAADRFADVGLPAAHAGERRPEAVRDLVHERRGEIAVGGGAPGLRWIHHARGERQDHLVDARVHEVLEEDLLRALLLMDAGIVRQVVGHGLVAVAQVARAKRRVHHFHRRRVAAHRRPIGRRERQRVLDVGDVALVEGELLAFRLVADQDGRAVRRLHAEQIVEVGLVGGVDDVELGVLQVDPRDVAVVVVVGEDRVGAKPQERGERRIVGEVGGLAQRGGGGRGERRELAVVPLAREIGPAGPGPRHDGVRVVDRGLARGVSGDVGLDLRACQPGRVQGVPGRHRHRPDKRRVGVHQVEPAAVDEQVVPQRLRDRRALVLERVVERQALGIALPPVHVLELAQRDDELIDHRALARAERGRVVRHLHGREPRETSIEIGRDRLERGRDVDRRLREHAAGRREQQGHDRAFHARIVTWISISDLGMHAFSESWLARFRDRVNADPEMAVVGDWFTTAFSLTCGDRRCIVRFEKGKLVETNTAPRLDARCAFGFRASEAIWSRFLSPEPEPLYHDFFAMQNARALHRAMNVMRTLGQ